MEFKQGAPMIQCMMTSAFEVRRRLLCRKRQSGIGLKALVQRGCLNASFRQMFSQHAFPIRCPRDGERPKGDLT
jgi:hypothetical protein